MLIQSKKALLELLVVQGSPEWGFTLKKGRVSGFL